MNFIQYTVKLFSLPQLEKYLMMLSKSIHSASSRTTYAKNN